MSFIKFCYWPFSYESSSLKTLTFVVTQVIFSVFCQSKICRCQLCVIRCVSIKLKSKIWKSQSKRVRIGHVSINGANYIYTLAVSNTPTLLGSQTNNFSQKYLKRKWKDHIYMLSFSQLIVTLACELLKVIQSRWQNVEGLTINSNYKTTNNNSDHGGPRTYEKGSGNGGVIRVTQRKSYVF